MYPKKTFNFRFNQICFMIALIIFTIGLIGIGFHFGSFSKLPFRSSLFGYHSALLEIGISILLVFQCIYIYEEENKRYLENYRTPEQLRDEWEAKELRDYGKIK